MHILIRKEHVLAPMCQALSHVLSLITATIARKSTVKCEIWAFLGGRVGRNPPSRAGDTNLVPGPGRPHLPQSG